MADLVGFVGLGTMGGPMAANLARAGVPLVVHDASAAALAAAAKLPGARAADSVRQVAASAAVLFTCLPNDAIVRQVYLGDAGIGVAGARGLVTCDCSTVSADTTVEVHRALAARGIDHMDTPMLGSQPQAVSGEIFFIVGGSEARVPAIARYLDVMGRLHMYVGPAGTANRVKLIHNGLAAVTAVAVAESLAVAVQSGVDPYVLYEVIKNGGGMAFGTYFDRRAKRILDGDFSPTFMAELMLKDVNLALALAQGAKVPTPMLQETQRTYDEAVRAGWGREDFSAVTHVVETRIGRKVTVEVGGSEPPLPPTPPTGSKP